MIRASPLRGFFRWVLRAQWGIALAGLALFTDVPRWGLGVAIAAGVAGTAMDRADSPRAALSRWSAPVLALFLAAATADLLMGGRDLLSSVSLLVLGVQSVRFLLPKRSREGWHLCAAALLEFLASAAGTDAPAFAPYAFLFFVSSAGAMFALHDLEEAESGRPPGGYAVPARGAAAILFSAGAAGFLAAAVLFAVVPRLEFRRPVAGAVSGKGAAGFTDSIALHEVTKIKKDRRVVARVEFPDSFREFHPAGLYLRGAVFPRYDGGVWRRGDALFRTLPRAGFVHVAGDAAGPPSTADITLEPADHPALFIYGHPESIEGSFAPVLSDEGGNFSLAAAGHQTLRYRVRFSAFPPGGKTNRRPAGEMDFPADHEAIRTLSMEIVGDAGDDRTRMERILRFFRSGFRYTLDGPAADIHEFLFRKRAGTCEHFAAGLALVLRGAGIPARVAAGYLGGEWNPLGNYLIVRQTDAHAWVEAWIGGGWRTVDATPSAGSSAPFAPRTGAVGLYADWFRQRWNKYVIDYSMRMQADALAGGGRALRRAGNVFPRAWVGDRTGGVARFAAWAVLLQAPLLLFLRRILGKQRTADAETPPAGRVGLPRPYARLLRRLERRGFRRSPGEPMAEALEAAVRGNPRLSQEAARFLELYHRERFSGRPLSRELLLESFRSADRLRPGKRRFPPGKTP